MAHLSDGNGTSGIIVFVLAAIGVGIGDGPCIITVYEGPSAMLRKREKILLRIQDEEHLALCQRERFLVKRENSARAAGAMCPLLRIRLLDFQVLFFSQTYDSYTPRSSCFAFLEEAESELKDWIPWTTSQLRDRATILDGRIRLLGDAMKVCSRLKPQPLFKLMIRRPCGGSWPGARSPSVFSELNADQRG